MLLFRNGREGKGHLMVQELRYMGDVFFTPRVSFCELAFYSLDSFFVFSSLFVINL